MDKESQKIETKAVNTLLDSAEIIEVPRRKMFGFGKALRKFRIYRLTGNTLLHISRLSINMIFDETELQDNPFGASKVFVAKNAMDVYRVVAYAILNRELAIRLLGNVLARYLSNRLPAKETLDLTVKILDLSDYGSFIATIRLMKGLNIVRPKKDIHLSPEVKGG